MFKERLSDIIGMKVFEYTYLREGHTFQLDWGRPGDVVPLNRSVLNLTNFLNQKPFQFLDEKVRVGESVIVWLKTEPALRTDGWQTYRTTMLKHPEATFAIGKAKRKLLGRAIKGRIGVTEKLEPYVYTDEYRFGSSEIKSIALTDVSSKLKEASINTSSGTMFYDSNNRIVQLPDGNTVSARYLPDLKRLIREVGL